MLIFPDDWDLSDVASLESMLGPGRPACPDTESTNRFYGDIWLLERIAEDTGIRQDLLETFSGNAELVDQIMTLAMFPYLTRFNYDRVARWQRVAKSPSDTPLTPGAVTRLTQGITTKKTTHYQHFINAVVFFSKEILTFRKEYISLHNNTYYH